MSKVIFFSSHRFVCGKSKRGSTHLQVWKTYGCGFMVILILCCLSAVAVDEYLDPLEIPQMGLVAWWKFDEGEGRSAIDSVALKRDAISGNFRYLPGVSGSAIKFDGITGHIIRKAGKAPRFAEAFSIEAWVAPQAYPWNWCAIVNQQEEHEAGYFFGIDEVGHVGLHLAIKGKWYECTSKETIPFMEKWSHIAGTFDKDSGITVYIDGKAVAYLPVKGRLSFADDVNLQIGRNHEKTLLSCESLVRKEVNFPTSYSFDGIIDELKIYNRTLSADEIEQAYKESKPKGKPPLQWRKLPELAAGGNRFGAVYCKLKFYEEWDALWRVGDYPDVVVTFDEGHYKMVFWRGTNYNMNLVTENGKWVGDQSAECGGDDVIGCCEHMSDKQCRYAHVRIIENHPARVVVHWRYALCDVLYKIARVDEDTGWGVWADEYYYIYPDGVAVRHFTVYGVEGCSITEPTVLNQPGEKAEDNVELAAVTMANMKGQTRTHTWDPWPSNGRTAAPFSNALPGANICVVNLKSKYKPFYIYEPGTRIIPYGGGLRELRTEYSRFPTWNHWPVSQAPSDGRYALVPDRVSSSAITSPEPPMRRRPEDGAVEGRFIMGLSDKAVKKLAPLARMWLRPPKLKVFGQAFNNKGYSRNERAYILSRDPAHLPQSLDFELVGSSDSPVVNPAFVINNWGPDDATLEIDGKKMRRGKYFRFGHHHTLESTDLIVWMKKESTRPVKISLIPAAD